MIVFLVACQTLADTAVLMYDEQCMLLQTVKWTNDPFTLKAVSCKVAVVVC